MNSAAKAILRALETDQPEADGRRARSLASRTKIIRAAIELVAAGDPNPSAAAVAERAGVGLRSVFRHFEDKDAIFRAIDDLLVAAYQPLLDAPYRSDDWKDRLFELIERRCTINEAGGVFRISAVAERYRSKFVAQNYTRLHASEKRMLDAILPEQLQTSTRLGRAILVACSFDTWRFLRQDEQLSPEATLAAMKELVSDVIEHANLS